MLRITSLGLLLLLCGCPLPAQIDLDGDGHAAIADGGQDCDDTDSSVNPDEEEVCDPDGQEHDNDCDGVRLDSDGDGWCPKDLVEGGEDCDDANPEMHPGAVEVCEASGEDLDNDCDGTSADGDGDHVCSVDYFGQDCDDSDPAIGPGATEVCDGDPEADKDDVDNDCDGLSADVDGDGECHLDYGGGDCDDLNPSVNSTSAEVCSADGLALDEDCDGRIDEDFDQDGDGQATCRGDCDDCRREIHEGALEVCDGHDNDCDGGVDEAAETVCAEASVTYVSAGREHTLAMTSDDRLWGWGAVGLSREEGCGGSEWRKPRQIQLYDGAGVVIRPAIVVAGAGTSYVIDDGGQVWSWGYNGYGKLGQGASEGELDFNPEPGRVLLPVRTRIVALATGVSHVVALDQDGQVWAWGWLHLDVSFYQDTPVNLMEREGWPSSDLPYVAAVAAGAYHTLLLGGDNTVWAYGLMNEGQLGDGTSAPGEAFAPKWPPVKATFPEGIEISQIAAGGYHSLATDTTGDVWGWGDNSRGQLGTEVALEVTPVRLLQSACPDATLRIAGGMYFTMVSTCLDDGSYDGVVGLTAFGNWLSPGDDSDPGAPEHRPDEAWPGTLYDFRGDVAQAYTGGWHSVAITAPTDGPGLAFAWGPNYRGQLGNGTSGDATSPTLVLFPWTVVD